MTELIKEHPVVAAFFAKHIAEWVEWASWAQDEAITEALKAINRKGRYVLSKDYTISGKREILEFYGVTTAQTAKQRDQLRTQRNKDANLVKISPSYWVHESRREDALEAIRETMSAKDYKKPKRKR